LNIRDNCFNGESVIQILNFITKDTREVDLSMNFIAEPDWKPVIN